MGGWALVMSWASCGAGTPSEAKSEAKGELVHEPDSNRNESQCPSISPNPNGEGNPGRVCARIRFRRRGYVFANKFEKSSPDFESEFEFDFECEPDFEAKSEAALASPSMRLARYSM